MSDVVVKVKDKKTFIELQKINSNDLYLIKDINDQLIDDEPKLDLVDITENEIITPKFKSILASSWRYSKSQFTKEKRNGFIGCSTVSLIVFIATFVTVFHHNSTSIFYMIGINIRGDIDLEFKSITGLQPVSSDS